MLKRIGKRTIEFVSGPRILGCGSAAGKNESEGPLGSLFDKTFEDDKLGKKSWEYAETELQRVAINEAISKSGVIPEDIDCLFGGDLLNQCTATSYCARGFDMPFFGMFNACATMSEGILAASLWVDGGYAGKTVVVSSSHFCTAERQFRFPLEYGGQRPPTAQRTVTASGSVIIGREDCPGLPVRVKKAVLGKVIDLGITDANNMGAAMAPAFFDTLLCFLNDTNTNPDEYDLIVSGDLGSIGMDIAKELFRKEGVILGPNYNDCGMMMYHNKEQDVHAGASGCGCSASVLCAKILPQMTDGTYKRVLFIGTGALMSPMMIYQKESIASIAHLVELTVD